MNIYTSCFEGLRWYTPAETYVPLSSLLKALLFTTQDFDKALGRIFFDSKCMLAHSARELLFLLLVELQQKNKERNEVLIPGYTCYSVAAAIVRAGLQVRVYDIDPQTFCPDVDTLTKGLSERTLAVVTQHLCGVPVQLDDVQTLTHQVGAYLIEDAAQAMGGSISGHPLGTMGDFGLFSFGRGKPLPLGEGGALIWHDETINVPNKAVNSARKGSKTLLKTVAVRILGQPLIYGIMENLPLGLGQTVFDPNFTIKPMSESLRRLGTYYLPELESLNNHRRTVASIYNNELGKPGTIPVAKQAIPVYPRYPYMAGPATINRNLQQFGIRRMYPQAIQDVSSIKPYLVRDIIPTPGAARIARDMITLPTHSGIKLELAPKIVSQVKEVFSC